ncbi:MAG TPA: glycosyltransferase, partial [Marmoricola sp.]|nr:glycosyltransferase [Marmoricola sp.]
MKVTTILVSHNGARWLPAVLAGIQSQHRAADQVLVVDTGSTDDTLARLESTPYQVLSVDAATTYPMA